MYARPPCAQIELVSSFLFTCCSLLLRAPPQVPHGLCCIWSAWGYLGLLGAALGCPGLLGAALGFPGLLGAALGCPGLPWVALGQLHGLHGICGLMLAHAHRLGLGHRDGTRLHMLIHIVASVL